MGDPRRLKKRFKTPSHPWQVERITEERELTHKYGLKNRREIWKTNAMLEKIRRIARDMMASEPTPELRAFLDRLVGIGLIAPEAALEDVLALGVEDLLGRRLQTLVFSKGLANTPKHARQLIAHGHVTIGDRRVNIPSYVVKKVEEEGIALRGVA